MNVEEAIKFLKQLYPNGGHCWLDEQRIEAIGMAIKALQEEPISEDLEEAAEAWSNNDDNTGSCDYIGATVCQHAFKAGAQWQKEQFDKDEEILILKDRIESLHAARMAIKETHRIELEKQAGYAKFCDSIQVGDKVTRNQDGMLVNLSQLKRVAKPTEEDSIEIAIQEV